MSDSGANDQADPSPGDTVPAGATPADAAPADATHRALDLITKSQRALYGYIFSLVASRELADEILQDTNVVLCRKIGEFDGSVKFTTWACRVAYFEVLAQRKSQHRRREQLVDGELLEQIAAEAAQATADADDRIAAMRRCVDALPQHSREMIDLRYEPGGSVKLVAERFGRSVDGVRVTLHRIRRILLECIERSLSLEG